MATMAKNSILAKLPGGKLLLFAGFFSLIAGASLAVPLSRIEVIEQQQAKAMQSDQEFKYLVEQVHRGINEYRASLNLPPLKLNSLINQQAAIHSQKMAEQEVKFGHYGFKARVEVLRSGIAYRQAAENVAFNQGYQDPAQTAITGWIDSEGHHENMIGDFNLTGIGVARNNQGEYYFTQIFIKGK